MGTQKGNMGTQSVASTIPWVGSWLGGCWPGPRHAFGQGEHFGLTSCPWGSQPKPDFPQPREAGPLTREKREAPGMGADARRFFPLSPRR